MEQLNALRNEWGLSSGKQPDPNPALEGAHSQGGSNQSKQSGLTLEEENYRQQQELVAQRNEILLLKTRLAEIEIAQQDREAQEQRQRMLVEAAVGTTKAQLEVESLLLEMLKDASPENAHAEEQLSMHGEKLQPSPRFSPPGRDRSPTDPLGIFFPSMHSHTDTLVTPPLNP